MAAYLLCRTGKQTREVRGEGCIMDEGLCGNLWYWRSEDLFVLISNGFLVRTDAGRRGFSNRGSSEQDCDDERDLWYAERCISLVRMLQQQLHKLIRAHSMMVDERVDVRGTMVLITAVA